MKHKQLVKKMILNKETVTRLDGEEMRKMMGGTQTMLTMVITVCMTPPPVTRNC